MTTTIVSGGEYDDHIIHAGSTVVIEGSAFSEQNTVQSGGTLIISSGALPGPTDKFTSIESGGTEYLSGTSSYEDGYFGAIEGTQIVLSGGEASATEVGSGGQIFVSSASQVVGALVSGGGTITVFDDGEATGDSLIRGAVEVVSAGGLAFGEVVNAGAILTVSAGGADDTTLYGGKMVVFAGGSVAETIISSGGLEAIDAGGQTALDTVFSGGVQAVASKGLASGVDVLGGGSQTVASGGTVVESVLSGGAVFVSAGATLTDASIEAGTLDIQAGAIAGGGISFSRAGGVLRIDGPTIPALTVSGFNLGDTIELTGIGYASGPAPTMGSNNVLSFTEGGSSYTVAFDPAQNFSGVVFEAVPNGAGTQIQISGLGGPVVTGGEVLTVSAGQHSSLLTVEDGGSAVVLSGGVMFSSLITDGGTLEVSSGGMASSLAISNEGLVRISAGGSATDLTVDRGGVLAALGGITSTTVDGGLFQIVSGNSSDTLISGGGNEVVYGGADSDTTVDSGGQQDVYGGSAVDAIINSDGLQQASVPVISTTVNSGGHAIVNERGVASNTVLDGGLLDLTPDGSATGAITFGPRGGELRIYGGGVESAVISGFAPGDLIELLSIPPGIAPTATIDPSNFMLIVSAGGTTYDLPFAASAASAHFQVATDGVSGSYVTELPCFAAGTRIATGRGQVAVQDLRVGEAVLTQAGRLAPVRWLGHRRVECGRHPNPQKLWPVRVRAGAFGRGAPHRDLLLSPDHAVYFDGVLIPVRCLINGATIVQEAAEFVAYWHVELERHDIVLAEGLPTESFLDTGNRAAFENGGALVQMHPDFSQRLWDGDTCAPLVIAGPQLERVRAWLHRCPSDENPADTQPSLRRNFLHG